jgi:large subunit ribosomal protein L15
LGVNVYDVISIEQLNSFDNGAIVTSEAIYARGYGRRAGARAGVKILGGEGELTKKLTVRVEAVSEKAKSKIEGAGGAVELVTCGSCSAPAQA